MNETGEKLLEGRAHPSSRCSFDNIQSSRGNLHRREANEWENVGSVVVRLPLHFGDRFTVFIAFRFFLWITWNVDCRVFLPNYDVGSMRANA